MRTVGQRHLDPLSGGDLHGEDLVGEAVARIYIGRVTDAQQQGDHGSDPHHAAHERPHPLPRRTSRPVVFGRRRTRNAADPGLPGGCGPLLQLGFIHFRSLEDESDLVELAHVFGRSVEPIGDFALLLFRTLSFEIFQYIGRLHREHIFLINPSLSPSRVPEPSGKLVTPFFPLFSSIYCTNNRVGQQKKPNRANKYF